MAYWGIAAANGPHINSPNVDEDHAKAAWKAFGKARELASGASAVEQALIEAMGKRYAEKQPSDRHPLDVAYADAMQKVWDAHSDDPTSAALTAEALMDLRPWDQWTPAGKPQPGTEEVLAILDAVLAKSPEHPLADHLMIHAVEASPASRTSRRGRRSPPRPDARNRPPSAHAVAHRRPPWSLAGRGGRQRESDRGGQRLSHDGAAAGVLPTLHGPQPSHAGVRGHDAGAKPEGHGDDQGVFGLDPRRRDQEPGGANRRLLFVPLRVACPLRPMGRNACRTEAARRHAHRHRVLALRRGVSFAAKGQVAEAKAEQKEFKAAAKRIPATATFSKNLVLSLLGVAGKMLDGEILYREGKVDEAIAALRESAKREDRLHYAEPPAWIQPVRHALGAALLESHRYADAEQVYRDDLARYPNNGWSLFGLSARSSSRARRPRR